MIDCRHYILMKLGSSEENEDESEFAGLVVPLYRNILDSNIMRRQSSNSNTRRKTEVTQLLQSSSDYGSFVRVLRFFTLVDMSSK